MAKVLLMPLLALFCIACGHVQGWVIAGLGLGFLGDALLINQSNKICFMGGLVSFLLGHVCYLVAMIQEIPAYAPIPSFAVGLLLLCIAAAAYASLIESVPEDMHLPVIAYLLMLVAVNFFAFSALLARPSLPTGLLFAGTLLFFASDYILARGQFRKALPRQHFYIMSTYILAQLGIALWSIL